MMIDYTFEYIGHRRIKQVRNDHKLTQAEFGDLFGATFKAVSSWEADNDRDRRIPPIPVLLAISWWAGVTPEWLVGKSNDPTSRFSGWDRTIAQFVTAGIEPEEAEARIPLILAARPVT